MSTRERERTKARRVSAAEWADSQESGWEPTSVKLPDGVDRFEIKSTGKHKLDIIPYEAGDNNPDADKGYQICSMTFWTHWVPNLEGKKKPYCCSARCFKEKCPVCDWVAENRDADKELIEDLKPKKRMLWNVVDLLAKTNEGKRDRAIKIWETAYFKSFGEQLKDLVQVSDKYADFDDPEKGMTVQLAVRENDSGFGKFKIARVDLLPRDEQYDSGIVDKAHCLDELLVKPDYDEVRALLEGKPSADTEDEEDEDEPEEPSDIEEEEDEEEDRTNHKAGKGKKKKAPVAEEEDEEDESDEDEETETDDEDEESPDDDDDWGDEDEDEEEDSADEDEEDEEDEDDNDEPPPKRKPKAASGKKKKKAGRK